MLECFCVLHLLSVLPAINEQLVVNFKRPFLRLRLLFNDAKIFFLSDYAINRQNNRYNTRLLALNNIQVLSAGKTDILDVDAALEDLAN